MKFLMSFSPIVFGVMTSSYAQGAMTCDPEAYWNEIQAEFMPLYEHTLQEISATEWPQKPCETAAIMATALFLEKEAQRTNCGEVLYHVNQDLEAVKIIEEGAQYEVSFSLIESDGFEIRRFATVLAAGQTESTCKITEVR